MDERKKETILNRLNLVNNKKRRVTFFANFMIVLLIMVLPSACVSKISYTDYVIDTGLPPLVLIFFVYVIKVVAVEYLNGRGEILQKELDSLYDQEKQTE